MHVLSESVGKGGFIFNVQNKNKRIKLYTAIIFVNNYPIICAGRYAERYEIRNADVHPGFS